MGLLRPGSTTKITGEVIRPRTKIMPTNNNNNNDDDDDKNIHRFDKKTTLFKAGSRTLGGVHGSLGVGVDGAGWGGGDSGTGVVGRRSGSELKVVYRASY